MKCILNLITLVFLSIYCNAQSYNFEQATKAYKDGDWDTALDFFGREINDNPKSGVAYYYRAIIYLYKEQNVFAIKEINNALNHIPSKEKKWVSAAYIIRAKIYSKIENYEKAIEDYNLAVKQTPVEPKVYEERAQLYFDLGQFEKSENDYKKIIKIDETKVIAYAGLGRNYIHQKKYTDAEKILNQLIKLSPDYSEGFRFRAQMYFQQNKFDEAIEDIFKAYIISEKDYNLRSLLIEYSLFNYPLALAKINTFINSNPEIEDWYFIRARIQEEIKDYKSAILDYTKLMKLTDPAYVSSILPYRAECYQNIGMHEQSLDDYDNAILKDSTNADYFGSRAKIKLLIGEQESALNDFTKAINIDPDEAWYYLGRGWLLEEFQKNNELALKDYNYAISFQNKYRRAYLHRGRLYEKKLNNPEKANEDYNTILSLDTSVSESNNYRQYALLFLNREKEAIDWMNKIIIKYPTNSNFYDAACLYSLMNRTSDAFKNLKKAFEYGYRNFNFLDNDMKLENLRKSPEYKELFTEWINKHKESVQKETLPMTEYNDAIQSVSIPMKSKGTGTYEINCKINDLSLNMIFDTGASDISISQTEVQFMLKNGYLNYNDITGSQKYVDANGDIEIGTTIILRKVDFGGFILKNIKATVVQSKNAPLLFGQSALSKYSKITIDNDKKIIIITR